MDRQLDRLRDIDPDILLTLDAARWDYWADEYGYGEPVRSPASCTRDWVGTIVGLTAGRDVTCVTASPIHARHYPDAFDRVDVWETGWRQVNGIPTVPPKVTTEAALRHLDDYGDLLYVHYIPPHGPYPFGPGGVGIPVMRANPQAEAVDLPDEDVPDRLVRDPMRIIRDADGWLTAERLREAYRANLRWVFDALLPFKGLDATVVVTSDHGEFLADGPDGGQYGHPCGVDHPLLTTVPLWVME